MRKILVLFWVFASIHLHSSEVINLKMNKVKEYKTKSAFPKKDRDKSLTDTLYINNSQGYSGPGGPALGYAFDKFFIFDQEAARSLVLDSNYDVSDIYHKGIYDKNIFEIDNYIVGYNRSNGIYIYELSDALIIKAKIRVFDFPNFRDSKDYFYYDNILFIYDKNWKLWSIKNPGLDKEANRENILNEEETLKLFKDGKIGELSIDSQNRLFLNGELKTVNFARFHLYFKELNNGDGWLSEVEGRNATDEASDNMTYIGKDNDGNYYWDGMGDIAVFRENGFMFKLFLYDEQLSSSTPTVSPEGDVYFIHHGTSVVTLYKIDRQW